jgi:hypothetical protein
MARVREASELAAEALGTSTRPRRRLVSVEDTTKRKRLKNGSWDRVHWFVRRSDEGLGWVLGFWSYQERRADGAVAGTSSFVVLREDGALFEGRHGMNVGPELELGPQGGTWTRVRVPGPHETVLPVCRPFPPEGTFTEPLQALLNLLQGHYPPREGEGEVAPEVRVRRAARAAAQAMSDSGRPALPLAVVEKQVKDTLLGGKRWLEPKQHVGSGWLLRSESLPYALAISDDGRLLRANSSPFGEDGHGPEVRLGRRRATPALAVHPSELDAGSAEMRALESELRRVTER